ncbi:LOW QUALITY PROTEIN: protein FAM162A-like [Ciconia maguari]
MQLYWQSYLKFCIVHPNWFHYSCGNSSSLTVGFGGFVCLCVCVVVFFLGQSPLRVPGHKPTDWEKRVLLWAGHFKKTEDIPETVSYIYLFKFKTYSQSCTTWPNGLFGSLIMSLFFYYYFLRIETITAAKITLHVKFSYVMMALTVLGVMVIKGKQAVKRHESLISINLEKKAQWRKEATQSTSAEP